MKSARPMTKVHLFYDNICLFPLSDCFMPQTCLVKPTEAPQAVHKWFRLCESPYSTNCWSVLYNLTQESGFIDFSGVCDQNFPFQKANSTSCFAGLLSCIFVFVRMKMIVFIVLMSFQLWNLNSFDFSTPCSNDN